MSIDLSGYDCDGPYPFDQWIPPHQSGIYALLLRTQAPDGSASLTPLFFGRTDDLARHDPHRHARVPNWTKGLTANARLLIGVHYMPGSNLFLRQMVEEALLKIYHPIGNYGWAWSQDDVRVNHCYT